MEQQHEEREQPPQARASEADLPGAPRVDDSFEAMHPLELDLAEAKLLEDQPLSAAARVPDAPAPAHEPVSDEPASEVVEPGSAMPSPEAADVAGSAAPEPARERARKRAATLDLAQALREADQLELEARWLREAAREREAERQAQAANDADKQAAASDQEDRGDDERGDEDDEDEGTNASVPARAEQAPARRTMPPPVPAAALLRSVEIQPPPILAATLAPGSLSIPTPPAPVELEDLTLELEETTVQSSPARAGFDTGGQAVGDAVPLAASGPFTPAIPSVRPGPVEERALRPRRPVLAPLAALAAGAAVIGVAAYVWLPSADLDGLTHPTDQAAASEPEPPPPAEELSAAAPSALPPAPAPALSEPRLQRAEARPSDDDDAQLERRRLLHEQRRAARRERRQRLAKERAGDDAPKASGPSWAWSGSAPQAARDAGKRATAQGLDGSLDRVHGKGRSRSSEGERGDPQRLERRLDRSLEN
jgi:hypothetical protein